MGQKEGNEDELSAKQGRENSEVTLKQMKETKQHKVAMIPKGIKRQNRKENKRRIKWKTRN